jgi:hypothetical protein
LRIIDKLRADKSLIIIIVLALVKLLIHLYTNAFASYGIFRDEYYYLACADRLGWGYVDQPPLSIYILHLSRIIFGDSLFAIRLIPAICGALTVFMAGIIARKLGGGKFAVLLAGIATIAAPILLAMDTIYSMNCIDILLWSIVVYVLILIINDNQPKHWILLGLLIGLGLLNKISMAWLAFGIFVSFLITNRRRVFLTIWPYVAGLIAVVIFSPYIFWNIAHDFAHLEFIRNATAEKYGGVTAIDFVAGQLLLMTPVSVLVWLSGLYYLVLHKKGREYRVLGLSLLIVFLILLINGHSKPEYLSPADPIAFAGGAVLIESATSRKYLVWLKYVLPVLILIVGAAVAPFAIPVLPVDKFIEYSNTTGVTVESNEGLELSELPQFYADMFGWEGKARTVSEVYMSLPPEEREKTIVFARNYGQAGAIEYYNDKYPEPPVYSQHNSFWIWAERDIGKDIRTVIFIGGGRAEPGDFCEEYELAAVIQCQYCIPYENDLPVYICRKLKYSLEQLHEMYKLYI